MKKKMLSLVVATMMTMSLVACGGAETTATEVNVTELMTSFQETQVEGESVATMALDADMIEGMYGITSDMYVAIEARTPMMSAQCDEYLFIEAADGQVDAIVEALEARQAYLVNPMNMGYPEHIEYANNYSLEVFADKYIVFAIGMSAEAVTEHFSSNF